MAADISIGRIGNAFSNPFVIRFQPMIDEINTKRTELDESARVAHMDGIFTSPLGSPLV